MVTIAFPPEPTPEWPPRRLAPRARRAANPVIRRAAQTYNQCVGLPRILDDYYVPVDEAEARRLADAYDFLPNLDRADPAVACAYDAFRSEIQAQWAFAISELGVRFAPWPYRGQPYCDSQEMMDDIRHHNRLFFFTGGEPHPYLGAIDPETGRSANEQFRAVHDLFGHAAEGYGFGARGEENAWLKHAQMFTPAAQLAMTTETRGQNAWFNFGRHNYDAHERPRHIPPTERPYAKQKVALFPASFCDWRRVLRERSGQEVSSCR